MLEPIVDHTPLTINFKSVKVEEKKEIFTANVTYYVATGYHTFSGKVPTNKMVAIRFNSKLVKGMGLRIGDKVSLGGLGIFSVEDRIPDYQKADIDVFMDSLDECNKFGRQYLTISKI
jgi:3D (Asp-Asp-Asp) domain-containing protein